MMPAERQVASCARQRLNDQEAQFPVPEHRDAPSRCRGQQPEEGLRRLRRRVVAVVDERDPSRNAVNLAAPQLPSAGGSPSAPLR